EVTMPWQLRINVRNDRATHIAPSKLERKEARVRDPASVCKTPEPHQPNRHVNCPQPTFIVHAESAIELVGLQADRRTTLKPHWICGGDRRAVGWALLDIEAKLWPEEPTCNLIAGS